MLSEADEGDVLPSLEMTSSSEEPLEGNGESDGEAPER